ncbi:MAG TPA: hypothetical protein VMB20_10360 [Candidatus Acidoferrum sp.]|nr:hypothetical protein [Candidatus Acidoferrum sp.]
MHKILASLFRISGARFRRADRPHIDNLRAGQFDERAPFGVYRAMLGIL